MAVVARSMVVITLLCLNLSLCIISVATKVCTEYKIFGLCTVSNADCVDHCKEDWGYPGGYCDYVEKPDLPVEQEGEEQLPDDSLLPGEDVDEGELDEQDILAAEEVPDLELDNFKVDYNQLYCFCCIDFDPDGP